ncbi:MAG: putative toxin-antitoxin system toxin component, PIN family [Nitrospirae bacterium]|nr:putative toxin-antitoxin system toxin component, PIN family [Nitrospirota bacterium]MDA8338010.1 putative toxin-antitoxin system toxin component, PIN family [Nitrospiraceae bacterium]
MKKAEIVIDTNVIVSALRSQRGASYKLLMELGSNRFDINVSVPLILEYESAAKRLIGKTKLKKRDIDDILDYICSEAKRWKIFYLWRPYLKDPKDDMVLEAAVTAKCDFIVTYNKDDFRNVRTFGLRVVAPKEFLKLIGVIK